MKVTTTKFIRRLRRRRRWSQNRLAYESGVCQSTIHNVENETRRVRFQTLQQLVHALGYELHVVMSVKPKNTGEKQSDMEEDKN